MQTLKIAMKRAELNTMMDFKKFVTRTLVEIAEKDQEHHTHHAAEYAENRLKDRAFTQSKMYQTACLFGIIDSMLAIAPISPPAVGRMAHHLEARTRHHPRLRSLFVEKATPLLEKLPSLSILAAHGLAHNVIESCASLACINKIAPAALAIVGFMDGFNPYQAGRFIHDFDAKLTKLSQTGHDHPVGPTALLIVTEGEAAFDKLSANNVRYHVGNGLISLCEKYAARVPELVERAQQLRAKTPSSLLPVEPARSATFATAALFKKPSNG